MATSNNSNVKRKIIGRAFSESSFQGSAIVLKEHNSNLHLRYADVSKEVFLSFVFKTQDNISCGNYPLQVTLKSVEALPPQALGRLVVRCNAPARPGHLDGKTADWYCALIPDGRTAFLPYSTVTEARKSSAQSNCLGSAEPIYKILGPDFKNVCKNAFRYWLKIQK